MLWPCTKGHNRNMYCIQKAHDTDAAALSVISVSIAALFTLAFVYNAYSSSLRVLPAVKRTFAFVISWYFRGYTTKNIKSTKPNNCYWNSEILNY